MTASYYSTSSSAATTGGDGAASGKIYTVTTRSELIQALYGNSATINADGTIKSGTLDSSKKIIYVSGSISLNTNASNVELTEDDYVTLANAASTTCAGYGYTTASTMWTAYKLAFAPSVWGNSKVVSGTSESARKCYADYQKKIVALNIPSNTSIIGVGSTAKIVHGNLVLGSSSAPVDNIVIRNITFEDSFDFFPQWDPTDSTTGRWNTSYDLISVMYATHVWIDHNEFSDGTRTDDLYPSVWTGTASDGTNYATAENYKFMHHDGLVDVTKIANYVTVSNNYFHDHDKTDLIGGTDTTSTTAENPNALKVTFHHNYWKNCKQRQPRVRLGQVHVYNNYYYNDLSSSTVYGWLVGWYAGQGAKLYVENNAVNVAAVTSASGVYGGSSSSTKATACATTMGTGYDSSYCSAYIYVNSGNLLNGSAMSVLDLSGNSVTTTTTPWYASGVTTGSPTATPSTFYSYTLETATNLATTVPANAGVAKASAGSTRKR